MKLQPNGNLSLWPSAQSQCTHGQLWDGKKFREGSTKTSLDILASPSAGSHQLQKGEKGDIYRLVPGTRHVAHSSDAREEHGLALMHSLQKQGTDANACTFLHQADNLFNGISLACMRFYGVAICIFHRGAVGHVRLLAEGGEGKERPADPRQPSRSISSASRSGNRMSAPITVPLPSLRTGTVHVPFATVHHVLSTTVDHVHPAQSLDHHPSPVEATTYGAKGLPANKVLEFGVEAPGVHRGMA
ncbi:hypothetical protein ABZP36_035848 [Zizania latifolia]